MNTLEAEKSSQNETTTASARRRLDPEALDRLVELLSNLDFEPQAAVLMRFAVPRTGAAYGVVLAEGEEPGTLRVGVSSGEPADVRHRAFGHLDAGHVRSVVGDTPLLHGDTSILQRIAGEWPGDETHCASLPLVNRSGEWMGVLLLAGVEPFDPAGWQALLDLAEASRDAFENARQVAKMRDLVIKDDTAHCYNRRYFEEFLPEELSRANRFHAPLSLIFLDMDNLKQVNNAYGHSRGSQTLTEVSSRIRRKIRKFDRLFRFGGDEFCILLPETEWHGAMEVAERVRDAIASEPFLTADLGREGVPMSASLGIASYPLHARTQKDLIQEADRAMQSVKKGVKNSVAVAEFVDESEPNSQSS